MLLWNKYKKSKKKEYLETLLAHNNEDAINLEFLLYQSYNLLLKKESDFTPPLDLIMPKYYKNTFSRVERFLSKETKQ